tara:strand:+ start:648 stop:839 length:192 start_codon:yes stop_codon:yes gene_type:complete
MAKVSKQIKDAHQRLLNFQYRKGQLAGLELAFLILDGIVDPEQLESLREYMDELEKELYADVE